MILIKNIICKLTDLFYKTISTSFYDERGFFHKENGPADICDGICRYFIHGRQIPVNSTQELKEYLNLPENVVFKFKYYENDGFIFGYRRKDNVFILHNESGPSVIAPLFKEWYQHGKLHREDGPAFEGKVEGINSSYFNKRWWYNGKIIPVNNQKEFEQWKKLKVFQ